MWIQTLRDAVTNLASAGQRTLLALIGVVIGAASVIAMLNVGATAQYEALRQFRDMGVDILSLSITPGPDMNAGLRMETYDRLASLPEVVLVAPLMRANGSLSNGTVETSAPIVGITEAFAPVAKLQLAQGRFISDLDGYSDYIVLGQGLHQQLSRNAPVTLGQPLRFEGERIFTVVGILAPAAQSPMLPLDINRSAFIAAPATKRLDVNAAPREAVLRIATDIPAQQAISVVQGALQAEMPRVQLQIRSADQLIKSMEAQMQLFTLLLGAVGGISLVVGGVGVMNVMLVSVVERRREIGIRLALGTQRRWIARLFLVESVVLSIIGGIIGGILGTVAGYIAAGSFGWEFTPSQLALPLGIGVSVAIGVFFGYYPARQASRLDPIVALRGD